MGNDLGGSVETTTLDTDRATRGNRMAAPRRAVGPRWLPAQRALVFADALTERDGELRVWWTPHLARALPALRVLLDLPFERVVISHGAPVYDRAASERALELPAWRR